MSYMELNFTVTGATMAEIEKKAAAAVLKFASDPVDTVTYEVEPVAQEFGSEIPSMWQAEVQAVWK